jgi:hypothetical protein
MTFPDNISRYGEVKGEERKIWFQRFGVSKKIKFCNDFVTVFIILELRFLGTTLRGKN